MLEKPEQPKNMQEKVDNFLVSYQNKEIFDLLVDEIFKNETYKFYSEKNNPLIIDCGSNIGLSVLYFKKLFPGARITAIEPHSGNYNLLLKNLEQNNISDVVTHEYAIGDSEGLVNFYGDYRELGDTIGCTTIEELSHLEAFEKKEVEVKKLSSLITEEVDLLKLDIEGAEYKVLHDLIQEGKMSLVKKLHIELHGRRSDMQILKNNFKLLMEENGFLVEDRGLPRSDDQKVIYEEWSMQTDLSCCEFYCENKKFLENPFHSEIVARQWEKAIENEQETDRDNFIYPLLKKKLLSLKNGSIVLDIGCGQGTCAKLVPESCNYIGVDNSPLLLDSAKKRTGSNKAFLYGDADNLPFIENSFDLVFNVGVLFHINDLKKVFKEWYRVLKDNGECIVITANPNKYQDWEDGYLTKKKEGIRVEGRIQMPSGVLDHNVFYFHDEDSIVGEMTNSGFLEVKKECLSGQDDSFWVLYKGIK